MLAGEVALEAAADFFEGFAFGGAPGDVGLGLFAVQDPPFRDVVQRTVQLPVTAVVDAVPVDGFPAGRRDRGDTSRTRRRCGSALCG